jgi:ABC-type sugar transport system ATPase subunit
MTKSLKPDTQKPLPYGNAPQVTECVGTGGRMFRNTHAGQVTGVFGPIGSGRTEAAKTVAGVLKRNFFHGGEVRLDDRPVSCRLPRHAVLEGIV